MKKNTAAAVLIALLINCVLVTSEDTMTNPLMNKKPLEVIKYFNYTGKKYTVATKDGYLLSLHRIKNSPHRKIAKKNVSVLIQHGLFSSSMDWIITGPEQSLAFILADKGFDVWLGNFRGNAYSCGHKELTQNDTEYWDFSWHELGIYDLPAIIDYIFVKTGKKKVTFVGHSQANTAAYVLLSERPEYNQKIKALFSLAPVAFFENGDAILKTFSGAFYFINKVSLIKINGITFDSKRKFNIKKFCEEFFLTRVICAEMRKIIHASKADQYDEKMMEPVWQYHPSGSSWKQVVHFSQIITSGRFAKFDYVSETNWARYNRSDPPDYNLKNVKVPTYLFYSMYDLFTQKEDCMKLYQHLGNSKGLYMITYKDFNHFDFLWAKAVNRILYDHLVNLISRQTSNDNTLFSSEKLNSTSALKKCVKSRKLRNKNYFNQSVS